MMERLRGGDSVSNEIKDVCNIEVECACGCGEILTQRRKNQRFLNHRHKDQWHNAKKKEVLVAIKGLSDKDIKRVVEYIDKLKGKKDGSNK